MGKNTNEVVEEVKVVDINEAQKTTEQDLTAKAQAAGTKFVQGVVKVWASKPGRVVRKIAFGAICAVAGGAFDHFVLNGPSESVAEAIPEVATEVINGVETTTF